MAFWTNWNGFLIPKKWQTKLTFFQTKIINGWVWMGPYSSGKTYLAQKWLDRWIQWANVPKTNVFYINIASIYNWDGFLEQLDQWIVQKRVSSKQGDLDAWIWLDVCERLLVHQQWDLLERFKGDKIEQNWKRIGILWTTSTTQTWIPELLTGVQIWNWYDYISTNEFTNGWYQKMPKQTKPWNYNTFNDLQPIENIKQEQISLKTNCRIAWKAMIQQDLKGWVICGKHPELFRIPWTDLMDIMSHILYELPCINNRTLNEKFRVWWNEGIRLTPFFPRITSVWHQWNLWGEIGIRIFHNMKYFSSFMNVFFHFDIKKDYEINPQTWLSKLWMQPKITMNHLLLWGPPGGGKTSFVEFYIHKWFGNPLNKRWVYYRNSSDEKWFKLFRNELDPFIRMEEKFSPMTWRLVVLDEIDQMNIEEQEYLRSQMVFVQNEKLPIYFLLIANERSKLSWGLLARFQEIHWMTPDIKTIQEIFPITDDKKIILKPDHSLWYWWMEKSPRWWKEVSGDLRRYKTYYDLGCFGEQIQKSKWMSRGDLQDLLWHQWLETDNSSPSCINWNHIPILFLVSQQNKWYQIGIGKQQLENSIIPNYVQIIYIEWMKRSFILNSFPPNVTWVCPFGISHSMFVSHIWRQIHIIYKDWIWELYTIDIYDIKEQINWVRDNLKLKIQQILRQPKHGICYFILHAELLNDESQVILRRIIENTKDKILWWFGVENLYKWMEALRSRAEPFLFCSSNHLYKEIQNTEQGNRYFFQINT